MERFVAQSWGVILVNLGTPEAPTAKAVRDFLAEFLADQRVVEIPKLLWLPILHGVILPLRSKRVAKLYQSIWREGGSPLKVETEGQASALQSCIAARHPESSTTITYAMTYGPRNIASQIDELQKKGAERILVLPLYPQYSATTTAAIYDQCARLMLSKRDIPNISIHKSYYSRADYLVALSESIKEYRASHGESQKLLFSFHGIPQRCVDLGDPYFDHCKFTAEQVAQRLGLSTDQWGLSFQSRLGKAKWLQPYTDVVLRQWAESKVESVDVVCPAFAADCLETIEEIDVENRELFLACGGQSYHFIPCLNSQPRHIEMMANIVDEYTGL